VRAVSLPVGSTLLRAWEAVRQQGRQLLLLAAAPALLYLALHAAIDIAGFAGLFSEDVAVWVSLGWAVISKLPLAFFAVRCHRLILLSEGSREARGLFASETLLFFLVLAGIVLARWLAGMFPLKPSIGITLVTLVASVAVAYLSARFVLLLPRIAVGAHLSPSEVWAESRGNGWRLLGLHALAPLPIFVVVFLLHLAGFSWIEAVDPSLAPARFVALLFVATTAMFCTAAVEAAALSQSLRFMSEGSGQRLPAA
jgi:hypothetical protein